MEYLVEIYHYKNSTWVENGHNKLVRDKYDNKQDALRCAEMWYNKEEVRSIQITPLLTDKKIDFMESRKYYDRTELKQER